MSNQEVSFLQELLTFLFNAIALCFLSIVAIDFGTILLDTYKQVFEQSTNQSSTVTAPQALPQIPDPWLLPLEETSELTSINLIQTEQKYLRLLPPVKETSIAVVPQEVEDLLLGVGKLKLRQVRKIAKVLGIAQKVNGKDQKLDFLRNQIKLKLQQANSTIVQAVKLELIAC